MIARLICLVAGAAILALGICRASLALVVAGTALVAVALTRLGPAERAPLPSASRAGCPAPNDGGRETCSRDNVLPRALTMIAVALGLSAVTIALGSAETPVWLAIVTWLLSICALVGLGLTLDRLSARAALGAARSLVAGEHRTEVGAVLVIAGVALALRFYDLEAIPASFHEDEGEMARIALNVVNGTRVPFFKTAAEWGPSYPFNYLQAFWIWLFGSTSASARTASALAGVLCVPVVYVIGRLGWGPIAGAMAAWLLAVSHLHIHYSRLAQGFMVATLLAALTMMLLALAADRAKRGAEHEADDRGVMPRRTGTGFWTFTILAGAVAGISQHVYHATRIVPMIVGVLLIVLLMKRRVGRWHLEALGFAFLVAYAPLGVTYLESPGDFFIGLREISALRSSYAQELLGPGASLPRDLPALMFEQLRRTLGLFIRQADLSGYYPSGPPAFDAVTAMLIWLGLGAVLGRFGRYHEVALLVWLGFGVVFGSAVTIGGQNGNRILIIVPAVCLLGGVALARVRALLSRMPLRGADRLVAPVATALALWLLAANVVIYFIEYAPRVERAESTSLAGELHARGDEHHFHFLTDPHLVIPPTR